MAKSCELVSQITTSPRISFQKTPYIYYTTLGIYLILFFKREHELHGVSRQRFVLKQIYIYIYIKNKCASAKKK